MDLKGLFNIGILFILLQTNVFSQESIVRCINPTFDREVADNLSFSTPVISVADAFESKEDFTFLDAREYEEFAISHIENSIHIGYDKFDIKSLNSLDKETPLIVYCSIGYRSEKIGEILLANGFTNVSNLYGSIFEWVNQHHPVFSIDNMESNQIHTYNKKWSRWVTSKSIKKVF